MTNCNRSQLVQYHHHHQCYHVCIHRCLSQCMFQPQTHPEVCASGVGTACPKNGAPPCHMPARLLLCIACTVQYHGSVVGQLYFMRVLSPHCNQGASISAHLVGPRTAVGLLPKACSQSLIAQHSAALGRRSRGQAIRQFLTKVQDSHRCCWQMQ
jgi:hypothetical protein